MNGTMVLSLVIFSTNKMVLVFLMLSITLFSGWEEGVISEDLDISTVNQMILTSLFFW